MPKKLVSRTDHDYGGRRLKPGDKFEAELEQHATLLIALGRASPDLDDEATLPPLITPLQDGEQQRSLEAPRDRSMRAGRNYQSRGSSSTK